MASRPSETRIIFDYKNEALTARTGSLVQEFPLQLIVNGRELATLIASPHQLHLLVAGFLRLQGFVNQADDFLMLSVCEEFGTANVRIRGELPERLKPVLTSGCGTGISFNIPGVCPDQHSGSAPVSPGSIFSLMDSLARRAEQYQAHGGIHSAAVGKNGELLLYAEDLGRHNTLDRIAGEALLKGIDLTGTEMVTSGRVSTEMVAKASLLGIRLIASRTSPTNMAVALCDSAGICLAGYVRNNRFSVYSHPEMIEHYHTSSKIDGITGVILAGGLSTRMGRNKALLDAGGKRLIELVFGKMAHLFERIILVTNTPETYRFLPCPTTPDRYQDTGSLAGIHAALCASPTERVFIVACDMPFLSEPLIRDLCSRAETHDAVVPNGPTGLEPLHAVYSRSCLPIIESAIHAGAKRIFDLYPRFSNTLLVPWDVLEQHPGAAESFTNLNTPEEYNAVSPVSDKQHFV